MRQWIVALVLGVGACDGAIEAGGDASEAARGGYTLEVRVDEGAQTYLVVAPDGRIVGGRAADGASALMDSDRARALAAESPPQGEDLPEVISMRFPGFEMSISGDEEDKNGDRGQVRMSVGGAEGHNITVNADEGGPGDADDRAYVRITGADEDAVREFISEADALSPAVQAQMLAELGLD
jgi:hypothetical protein